MELNQLISSVVCKDERGQQLAKLLAEKFHKVYLIAELEDYQFWQEGRDEGTPEQLPSSVNSVFLHQEDYNLMEEIKIHSEFVFKFTLSGEPDIQRDELPIYRKVSLNQLNIQLEDIDEIIAYISKKQSQKPAICSRDNNIIEWESQVNVAECRTIRQRNEILNHLLSNLSNATREISEYGSLYKFLGTPKPIIYILDDYNRYITQQNGIYQIDESSVSNIAKYYREPMETSTRNHFIEVLRGLCVVLNNLSLSFTVKAYPLTLSVEEDDLKIEKIKPTYNLIYEALNLDNVDNEIDHNSPQIAAFIIDLEWLPNFTDEQTQQQTNERWWKEWKNMGVKAIDILSERYPEIPCFIFTGSQPANELQEALVHRAYWGFQKTKSHHYENADATTKDNQSNPEFLNCITIEQHLTKAVNRLYGSYQEVPSQQLNVNSSSILWQKLIKKLNLNLQSSLDNCVRGRAFKKLIAGLFPTSKQVEPIKVLTGGKSQAQATFLVSPILSNNDRLATRFIKIGSWFLIQKEYLAYQKVIQPRLNSYTANIIQRPILTEVDQNQMPWGALMYTLAGFPEDYHNLQSLNEVFTNYKISADGGNFLVKCVRDTLEKVLFPLYQSSISKSPEKQPLWCWLGDVMPSFYTGVLIPLIKIPSIDYLDENTKPSDIFIIPSTISDSNKHQDSSEKEELWKSAFDDLKKLNDQLNLQADNIPEISPHDHDIFNKPYPKVLLSNWQLISVDVPDNENEGNIILVHPILGMRVYLRGSAEDIRLRFGATWIRPGMKVNALVYLHTKTQRLQNISQNLSGFDQLDDNSNLEVHLKIIRNFKEANEISTSSIPSPVNVFGEEFCKPDNYISICGYAAPIHGDLNLNNILYAANETVGWLIDFERVKEKGLVAYDLAKLEGEIWVNHLLPYIRELAILSPAKVVDTCYKLLYFCLQSSEFSGDESEFFKTKVKSEKGFPLISDALLMPITNLLKVIKSIRDFGFSKYQLTRQELKWSLSAYFLNAARLHFPSRSDNDQSYATVLAFLVSAWHLIGIAPKSKIISEDDQNP
ncbi:MAG TPA: hypothetical protein VK184_13720 [Nostocaceae cyanobacterium]|nr:hypothetical protein [Nostocaceae cyanobacterium]